MLDEAQAQRRAPERTESGDTRRVAAKLVEEEHQQRDSEIELLLDGERPPPWHDDLARRLRVVAHVRVFHPQVAAPRSVQRARRKSNDGEDQVIGRKGSEDAAQIES